VIVTRSIVGHVLAGASRMSARTAGDAAIAEAGPWIERLGRVGFAAKGGLYLTIGVLAALAGLGSGGKTGSDPHDAMSSLLGTALGRLLLVVIAAGLVGYAACQILEGLKDTEHHGTTAKGVARRVVSVVNGLVHLVLAGTAVSLVLWHRTHGSEDANTRHWTARLLDLPGGSYLVWGVALGIAGYSVYQLYKAWVAKLDDELELDRLRARTRRIVVAISRFGIAARGIVFGTIAVLLARAAHTGSSREAGAMGDSMRELVTLGRWPFVAIAIGVAAYGIYQLICAGYRRIRV
jgi:Domain of Unknown Function (DUF1206)